MDIEYNKINTSILDFEEEKNYKNSKKKLNSHLNFNSKTSFL